MDTTTQFATGVVSELGTALVVSSAPVSPHYRSLGSGNPALSAAGATESQFLGGVGAAQGLSLGSYFARGGLFTLDATAFPGAL